jgi:hypothetical protein
MNLMFILWYREKSIKLPLIRIELICELPQGPCRGYITYFATVNFGMMGTTEVQASHTVWQSIGRHWPKIIIHLQISMHSGSGMPLPPLLSAAGLISLM